MGFHKHQGIEGSTKIWNPEKQKYTNISRSVVAGWYTKEFCERVITGFEEEMCWKPDFPFKPKRKLAVHAVKRALAGPDDTEAVLEAVEALRQTLVRNLLQDGYQRAEAERMAAAKATQQTEELRQQCGYASLILRGLRISATSV